MYTLIIILNDIILFTQTRNLKIIHVINIKQNKDIVMVIEMKVVILRRRVRIIE